MNNLKPFPIPSLPEQHKDQHPVWALAVLEDLRLMFEADGNRCCQSAIEDAIQKVETTLVAPQA